MKPSLLNSILALIIFFILIAKSSATGSSTLGPTKNRNNSIGTPNALARKVCPKTSRNFSTLEYPIKVRGNVVTDALIQEACLETRNPNFCQQIMKPFKGKRFYTDSFESVMMMAYNHVIETWSTFSNLEHGLKDDKSDLKPRYFRCWQKYSRAVDELTTARKFMSVGNTNCVKAFTSLAVFEVKSCDKEFTGPMRRYLPRNVAKDSTRIKDLCGIIMVLCACQ
ncbi:hypothetical protein ACP275_01G012100 [Erythranthe tilingii]